MADPAGRRNSPGYRDVHLCSRFLASLAAGDPTQWKDLRSRQYAWYLEYFETDHQGLAEPLPGSKLVLSGVKLPPEVLEKFYHANAEKLIPGLNKVEAVGSRSHPKANRDHRRTAVA